MRFWGGVVVDFFSSAKEEGSPRLCDGDLDQFRRPKILYADNG